MLEKGNKVRAINNVNISFGLVNIPIKTYSVACSNRISLKMVNPDTGNTVRQKLVDAVTGDEVDRSNCNRGFEIFRNKYVVFTNDELEKIRSPKSDNIEIVEFVSIEELNMLAIEKSFYLGPNKGGDKAYLVFCKAMTEKEVCAVGRWKTRGKDHLVIIRSVGDNLIMHQMYFDNEFRSFNNSCDNLSVSNAEVTMAKQLISKMTTKGFDSSVYFDSFAHDLREAAEKKNKGIRQLPNPLEQEKVLNLFDALKQSLVGTLSEEEIPTRVDNPKPRKKVAKKKTTARKGCRKKAI
jgi:DNA end-binding protein Ku